MHWPCPDNSKNMTLVWKSDGIGDSLINLVIKSLTNDFKILDKGAMLICHRKY